MPFYSSVRLSVRLFLLFVRPSVRPFVRPYVRPSVPSIHSPVSPFVSKSFRPSFCPSVRSSVRPSIHSIHSFPAYSWVLAKRLSYWSTIRPSVRQWKKACITPIPKVAHPAKASDYRPISITPVLSRMLEKHLVKTFIYPAFQQPPPGLHFADQFAFRPTGSTDAALITLLHTVFNMLDTQPYMLEYSGWISAKLLIRSNTMFSWKRWRA